MSDRTVTLDDLTSAVEALSPYAYPPLRRVWEALKDAASDRADVASLVADGDDAAEAALFASVSDEPFRPHGERLIAACLNLADALAAPVPPPVVTEVDALLAATDLAKLNLPRVVSWRVGRDVQTGRLTVDGQLHNDAADDIGPWADVLDASHVETVRHLNAPLFGTLAARGTHGGVPVRIWTAITRAGGAA